MKFPKHKNTKTPKHIICVSTVETLIYVLETLVYVLKTHNSNSYMYAKNTYETHNKLNILCFETHNFSNENNISYMSNDLKFCDDCNKIEIN